MAGRQLALTLTPWWKPEVNEAFKLKKEAFWAWLAGGSAEAADRYCLARRAEARAVTEAKNSCVGGVRGGHEEGLSAGLNKVLANCQTALERVVGLSPVGAEPAGPTANLLNPTC